MKKIAIATLLSAFVAAPAVADLYAGVKMGSVRYGYSNVTNNTQVGFGLLGGYAFDENLAIEAEQSNLGGFNFTDSAWKGSSLALKGVGSYPLNQKFSFFGKLGISRSTLEGTAKPGYNYQGAAKVNNIGLTGGLGGRYNFNKVMGIRLGIDSLPVGDSALGTSRASMTYVDGIYKF